MYIMTVSSIIHFTRHFVQMYSTFRFRAHFRGDIDQNVLPNFENLMVRNMIIISNTLWYWITYQQTLGPIHIERLRLRLFLWCLPSLNVNSITGMAPICQRRRNCKRNHSIWMNLYVLHLFTLFAFLND